MLLSLSSPALHLSRRGRCGVIHHTTKKEPQPIVVAELDLIDMTIHDYSMLPCVAVDYMIDIGIHVSSVILLNPNIPKTIACCFLLQTRKLDYS